MANEDLFCNIAWMDYYKGIVNGIDEPKNGGSYVSKNGDAHEAYNFECVKLGGEVGYPEGEYCLGFVETKATNGNTRNQLNIEKINGCELCKKESEVEDVLVIYCAKYPDSPKFPRKKALLPAALLSDKESVLHTKDLLYRFPPHRFLPA